MKRTHKSRVESIPATSCINDLDVIGRRPSSSAGSVGIECPLPAQSEYTASGTTLKIEFGAVFRRLLLRYIHGLLYGRHEIVDEGQQGFYNGDRTGTGSNE